MCTASCVVSSSWFGIKSYSTEGNVCTMFPRFPRTFKFLILSLCVCAGVMPLNRVGLGVSMNTCERSWKVRPNWAVLMASLNGVLVVDPMLILGFCSTGDRILFTLHTQRTHIETLNLYCWKKPYRFWLWEALVLKGS